MNKCFYSRNNIESFVTNFKSCIHTAKIGHKALSIQLILQYVFFVEKIKSEIRFEIDKQFRTEKIIIPFPQRTVWHGPERVTQFGDGIVGAGEVRSSETDAPLNRPF